MAQPNAGRSGLGGSTATEITREFERPIVPGGRHAERTEPVAVPDQADVTDRAEGGFSAARLSRAAGSSTGAARAAAPPSGVSPAGASPSGTARSGPAVSGSTGRQPSRNAPRRARLQVRHVSTWTVLKFSTLLAIALFLVWLIVVGLLYGALDSSGVINKINDTVTTINGPGSTAPISTGVVFSGALVLGAVSAVLFILLSTIGSVIYNLCADVVGGIELTLAERD